MKTYIEIQRETLSALEEKLCAFISTVRIREFRNDPNSGVYVLTHPYFYDTAISDEQKRAQIELMKVFREWEEHSLLLTINMPKTTAEQLQESNDFLRMQIELESDWGTEQTSEQNLNQVRERIAAVQSVLKPFDDKSRTILAPDTNALISDPEFNEYTKIAGEEIVIIVFPTVLQELDNLKVTHREQDFRRKVDSVIRRIKGLRQQGSLIAGVKVNKSITVVMIAAEPDFDHTLSWLDRNNNDDRIVASAIEYWRTNPSDRLILVTSDLNLQNKLELAKIPYSEPPSKI